ncbi:hypothetical protein [Symbioplanes lichenis]|uniref:hypothetical protein n=1 Tax=Symbioplanes lichenis TaxID=1629072 RepID=UPI002738CD4C|nr:hypothetical protein [Actinoplanes lichenis]
MAFLTASEVWEPVLAVELLLLPEEVPLVPEESEPVLGVLLHPPQPSLSPST